MNARGRLLPWMIAKERQLKKTVQDECYGHRFPNKKSENDKTERPFFPSPSLAVSIVPFVIDGSFRTDGALARYREKEREKERLDRRESRHSKTHRYKKAFTLDASAIGSGRFSFFLAVDRELEPPCRSTLHFASFPMVMSSTWSNNISREAHNWNSNR